MLGTLVCLGNSLQIGTKIRQGENNGPRSNRPQNGRPFRALTTT